MRIDDHERDIGGGKTCVCVGQVTHRITNKFEDLRCDQL